MRLIDADKFKNRFGYQGLESENDILWNRTVRIMIENEPTAYDLDEVLRELEKIKLKAYELRGKPHMDYGTLCGWISATDKAIEIVKRCGGDRGVD